MLSGQHFEIGWPMRMVKQYSVRSPTALTPVCHLTSVGGALVDQHIVDMFELRLVELLEAQTGAALGRAADSSSRVVRIL